MPLSFLAAIGADQREVFGLGNISGDDNSSLGDEDDDEDDDIASSDEENSHKPRQYKRLEKEKAAKAAAADLSDDDEAASGASDSDDDLARWGSNKRAYYNTNDLSKMDSDSEIDADEARRLELEEVTRRQRKARQGMEDADFGLGEADELGGAEEGGRGVKERERRRAELDEPTVAIEQSNAASTEMAPQELPSDPVARAALLAQLQKASPETVALAGEYADAVDQLLLTETVLEEFARLNPKHEGLGMFHLHCQTLYTYVTTLTFYFHLRASPKYASQPSLLTQHPVMSRILKLKEGLSAMEQLGFALPTEEEDADLSEGSDGIDDGTLIGANGKYDLSMFGGSEEDSDELGDLEDDELAQLIADEKENKKAVKSKGSKADGKVPKVKKSKPVAQPESQPATKKAKKDKKPKEIAPLAGLADEQDHLSSLIGSSSQRRKPASLAFIDDNGEAYGEATSLSASDLADKANKKKSLRFYTGQMDAKEARRGHAARDRMGGDSDIPYRDRERSRQAVEQARQAKEGAANRNGSAGAALDGEDWGEGDSRDWRDVMGIGSSTSNAASKSNGDDDDEADDYYDLVTGSRKEAKRAKKESYDSTRDSSRIIEDPSLPAGTHRSITRQISTNRGLTPHRKQDRNLRVKKRKKYEKAQKKLGSTRAVYKGGQGALQGGYQGESSGINTGVAKSRRFAN